MKLCSADGANRYSLGAAVATADDIKAVDVEPGLDDGTFVVDVSLNPKGTASLATMSRQLLNNAPPMDQVAMVVNGVVLGAPSVESPIIDGVVELNGDFTKARAAAVAAQVR